MSNIQDTWHQHLPTICTTAREAIKNSSVAILPSIMSGKKKRSSCSMLSFLFWFCVSSLGTDMFGRLEKKKTRVILTLLAMLHCRSFVQPKRIFDENSNNHVTKNFPFIAVSISQIKISRKTVYFEEIQKIRIIIFVSRKHLFYSCKFGIYFLWVLFFQTFEYLIDLPNE